MSVDTFSSSDGKCQGKIVTDNNWNITVNGVCEVVGGTSVRYAAAAPADLRMSYMGSGLPYPNEEVAYEGSPNIGEVPIKGGAFSFQIISPNCYYKDNGSTMVQSHVHFVIGSEYFDVPLPSARKFANRSLTGMPGRANRTAGR
jgi:hypothetical protein